MYEIITWQRHEHVRLTDDISQVSYPKFSLLRLGIGDRQNVIYDDSLFK
jgi:hypothetical protein